MFSTVSFLAYSIYEMVSIPLYLRIIYVLVSKKQFSAPFFKFLSVISILEICHYVIDVVFYRLPIFGPTSTWFGTSPSPIYTVATFLIYFFNYPIYIFHIAIALNRCTSVWAPVKQKAFWIRACKPIIGFAFAVSFLFTAHRLFTVAQLVPLDQSDQTKGSIPIIVKYQLYFIDTNLLTASFNTFVFLTSLIINSFTLCKIMQMKRAGNLKNAANKVEFNLFIISLWMTMTLVVLISFQLSLFMLRSGLLNNVLDVGSANYFLFMQQPLVEILGTESHPWVLLIMSGSIRAATLPFVATFKQRTSGISFVKPTPIITTVVSTITTAQTFKNSSSFGR
uniref:Serpentine receptor class gamma n=1 Tax=Globodera rostochiensis TaxID=31243 RepID=A0A914I447_GLORO